MIGIFDSGVGGLTVLKDIHARLPDYSTMYLGDTANAPFGVKNREEIFQLTWRGVKWLFDQGCYLVIVACNTASAQALREIQQRELHAYPGRKVLGIIIPTVEEVNELGNLNVAVLGTPATIASGAYLREFKKINPKLEVVQHACIDWVPLVEEGKAFTKEADRIVRHDLDKLFERDANPDVILLACTHYPVLINTVRDHIPDHIFVYDQGKMVAKRLADYIERHPEIDKKLEKKGVHKFYSTRDAEATTRVSKQIASWSAPFELVDFDKE